MGIKLLNRLAEDVSELGTVESSPRVDGRNMVMVIAPLKSKSDAKAEARKASAGAKGKSAEVKSRRDRVAAEKNAGDSDA
jgi:translation initiation factor IF-3